MGSRVGAAGTAFQGTAAYQGAAATAGEQVGLTINYGQIGLIIMFGFLYLVIASLGIDMFNKCPTLSPSLLQFHALFYWLRLRVAASVVLSFSSSASWVSSVAPPLSTGLGLVRMLRVTSLNLLSVLSAL